MPLAEITQCVEPVVPDAVNTDGGMSIMLIEIIGFLAAFTSTIALFPQIVKIYQTKSTADLSNIMLFNFLLTSAFWIAYGYMTGSMPVMVTNIIGAFCSLWLIQLKLKYD